MVSGGSPGRQPAATPPAAPGRAGPADAAHNARRHRDRGTGEQLEYVNDIAAWAVLAGLAAEVLAIALAAAAAVVAITAE